MPPYPQPAPSHGPPQNPYNQPSPAPYPNHQPPSGYNSAAHAPRHVSSPATHGPPHVVAPPMHWGFDNPSQGAYYPPPDSRPPNYPPYPDMRDHQAHHQARQPHDRQGSRSSHDYNAYPPTNQFARGEKFANRGNKRPHSSAFGTPRTPNTKPAAPLPVPSFGNPLPANPLPSKPPPSVDATRKHKKKRRKYNQLGLTPKTEEHESSESDNDADEESKLSQAVATDELKFTYRGQTSTLQSSTDIAAWIEERKKKYPTRARVEERLKQAQEKKQAIKEAKEAAKKAREDATRKRIAQEEQEKALMKEAAKARKEQAKLDRKALETADPADAAAKAKLKAEKLRRKLMKEEKRVARAEADAERARLRAEALKTHANGISEVEARSGTASGIAAEQGAVPDTSGGAPDITKPESTQTDKHMEFENPSLEQPTLNNENSTLIESDTVVTDLPTTTSEAPGVIEKTLHTAAQVATGDGLPPDLDVDDNLSLSSISEDESDLDDETSSSGSDSSDDSDSDSDSEPEQATSRRERPDRVLPPPRQQKNICHQFAKTGRCRRGDKCKYLHEASEQDGKMKAAVKPPDPVQDKNQRKTLLQALISREKEDEDRKVMMAISWLGQRGMLDELVAADDAAQGNPPDNAPPTA
ncbi:hypothetical protein FQN55_002993 [Onygenales sp. PD_40]|nr:hypothetical protein FQN55_002993 [Onygenales sp. PD_40]